MLKIIATFLSCFLFTQVFTQTEKKVATYFLAQYNKTISDITLGNNPSGAGFGLQIFFNCKANFSPSVEITGDVYLEDDKLARFANDVLIDDVSAMVNLFAGSTFHLKQNTYVSFLTGPSFIGGKTFLGIKPSVGFFFAKNQRWMGKISYLNIFDRDKQTKQDFRSVVFTLGLKLF